MALEDPRDKGTRGQRSSESRSGGAKSGGGRGGKGSEREDRALATQLDKVRNLPGANIGGFASGGGSNITPSGTYKHNPFGKPTLPATTTPNYPHATPGIIAGGLFDALGSVGPTGFASMMARALQSAYGGTPMSTGFGMDLAKQFGASTGPQIGTAGVGHEFSMDRNVPTGYQLPRGYMGPGAQMPQAQPQAPAAPSAPTYDTLNQPSMFLSPTKGYGVSTPAYSFFGPMKR